MISRTRPISARRCWSDCSPERPQGVDVEQGDAEDLRDAGVDVAGHGDVDDEHRPIVTPAHRLLDVGPLDEHVVGAGGRQHDVGLGQRGRDVVEADGPASDPFGQRPRPGSSVRLATTTSSTPAPASATAMRWPTSPAPMHQHPAAVERAESLGRRA